MVKVSDVDVECPVCSQTPRELELQLSISDTPVQYSVVCTECGQEVSKVSTEAVVTLL